MAETLFPVGYDEETVDVEQLTSVTSAVGFRNGVLFDEETGDFPRDGRHRLMDSTGIESWSSWVRNCIRTERYKHRAYSSDFGIEWDRVFRAASREEAESILTRQITEAVMADPYKRTSYVEDIVYTWSGMESVTLTITLHGREDVTIDVTAYITRGIA